MGTEHLVVPQHLLHIGTSFSNAWNFMPLDPMDTGVIGRQGQWKIALIEVQQMPQLLGASADILQRIVGVAHAQPGRGRRHQLHQTDCAFVRHNMLTKIRFGFDDRAQQGRVETIFLGVPDDGPMDFLFGVLMMSPVVVGFRRGGGGSDQQTRKNQHTSRAQQA